MLGIWGTSLYFKQNSSNKDGEKIIKIAENCGLYSKEEKIRLYRKSRNKKHDYTEYVFKIPLGLELKDFQDKKGKFVDGLNNRSAIHINLSDFKNLTFDLTILKQIKKILNNRIQLNKQIEMEYDGMLKMRVYNQPLTTNYTFEEATEKKISGWNVVVGKNRKGNRVLFDFEKKYNVIVSGTPGYGKSMWINTVINTLLMNHPDDVTFTLIDLKDGLEFNRYRNLKQVKSFAMTPDDARESLESAVKKMNEVNKYLREKGYSNVKDAGFKGRHFIIIDEGADLADDKVCQEYLADIARKGRAAGLKLIFATQYPTAEVVKSQIKRQCLGRLSFVLDTATASNVALDQGGAEELPAIEGRALYKDLKLVEVQTPYIDDKTIKENIEPHITFKSRGEKDAPQSDKKKAEGGAYTTIFEEV
jgi:DNA segregation ATPase FtsK/SpoIIIE, S-DNA-T family